MDPKSIPNASPEVRAAASMLVAIGGEVPPEDLHTLVTDDFWQQVLPHSLGYPKFNKEQLAQSVSMTLKKLEFRIHDIIEAPGKVIMLTTSEGVTKGGHAFTNENLITFGLTAGADGSTKIAYMREFIDSKTTSELAAKLSTAV